MSPLSFRAFLPLPLYSSVYTEALGQSLNLKRTEENLEEQHD